MKNTQINNFFEHFRIQIKEIAHLVSYTGLHSGNLKRATESIFTTVHNNSKTNWVKAIMYIFQDYVSWESWKFLKKRLLDPVKEKNE